MSIFGTIMSKIFHHGEAQAAPSTTASASPAPGTAAAPAPSAPPASHDDPTQLGKGSASQPTPSPGAAQGSVDVAQVLDGLAAKNSQTLDWKHSIVDMMKLLDLDSSIGNRQELAKELGYSGNMQDSAAMNVWLHKQVMAKLAENGGKVPDSLKA